MLTIYLIFFLFFILVYSFTLFLFLSLSLLKDRYRSIVQANERANNTEDQFKSIII